MKALKSLGALLWLVTGLGSLHIGLKALGWNLMGNAVMGGFALYVEYAFGAAGLLSLLMLAAHLGGSHMCNCSNCHCD
jgi:hypothetical protein